MCHRISDWDGKEKQISISSGLVWPAESCWSAKATVSSSQKEKDQIAEAIRVTKEGI